MPLSDRSALKNSRMDSNWNVVNCPLSRHSHVESQFFCKVPCSELQCFLIQGGQWQHFNFVTCRQSTVFSIFSRKSHFDNFLLFSKKCNISSHHFRSFNVKKMLIVQNNSSELQNLPSFYNITKPNAKFLFSSAFFKSISLEKRPSTGNWKRFWCQN